MEKKLEIITDSLLDEYCQLVGEDVLNQYKKLVDSELSIDTFSFYTSVSAVFSLKIESVT
jgi:hypothetical protein